jgi:4-hydroxysphinganine ceramide fatty acyl 2-hydroxylase
MNPELTQVWKIYFSQRRLWPWMALACLGWGYLFSTGTWWDFRWLVLLVLLLSPLNEYFIHRYLLHFPRPPAGSNKRGLRWAMDEIHYKHHEDPKAVRYVFAEGWLIAVGVVLDACLGYLLTWTWQGTLTFLCTNLAYYLLYEWTHWLAHSDYTPRNPYSRYMKKYHVWHHYKHEDLWYGITSPWGDFLFGRYRDPKDVQASEMALRNRGRLPS